MRPRNSIYMFSKKKKKFVLFAYETGKLDLIAKGLGLSAQLKKVILTSTLKNKFGIRPESHISETSPVK